MDPTVLMKTSACSIELSARTATVSCILRDMGAVKKLEMQGYLDVLSRVIKQAAPRDAADVSSGTTIVFDASGVSNLDLFMFLPLISKWTKEHAPYTQAAVRFSLVVVSSQFWKNSFHALLKLFPHTRPVHVVTSVEYDPQGKAVEPKTPRARCQKPNRAEAMQRREQHLREKNKC